MSNSIDQYPFVKLRSESEHLKQVKYRPVGFWSDMVSVNVWKSFRSGTDEKAEITWSAGGRDYDQEPDDTKAAMNFALALIDATIVAKAFNQVTKEDQSEQSN